MSQTLITDIQIYIRKSYVIDIPLITAVSFRGNTKTLSPKATMPVSTWPDTQNPDPVPLNISLTENRNGLSIWRSGHLKLLITLTNVGPVYLHDYTITINTLFYFMLNILYVLNKYLNNYTN